MRFTPRLFLMLVLLQLWGCTIDRKLSLKCKGDCEMGVNIDGKVEIDQERTK